MIPDQKIRKRSRTKNGQSQFEAEKEVEMREITSANLFFLRDPHRRWHRVKLWTGSYTEEGSSMRVEMAVATGRRKGIRRVMWRK